MLRRLSHPPEHFLLEIKRHPGVEQVAHRVHEDPPACPPLPRNVQRTRVELHAEAGSAGARITVGLVLRRPHPLQPASKLQRVAVVAARADLVAAGGGIPGSFRPLDRAVLARERRPSDERVLRLPGDRALPEHRSDELPSRRDFEIADLLGIVERVRQEWDDLPPLIIGRDDYRQLITSATTVYAVTVDAQLAPDGVIELIDITIDTDTSWPDDTDPY